MIRRLLDRWEKRGTPRNHPFVNTTPTGIDWRGLPTPECFCGERVFLMFAWFDDDREVGGYLLDGLCSACGALVTLPTPIDFAVMGDE